MNVNQVMPSINKTTGNKLLLLRKENPDLFFDSKVLDIIRKNPVCTEFGTDLIKIVTPNDSNNIKPVINALNESSIKFNVIA